MSDFTTQELARITTRLEKAVEKLEESTVSQEDLNNRVSPIEHRVSSLEDSYRWLNRMVLAAVITALLSIALRLPSI